jgi:hypothetical protein
MPAQRRGDLRFFMTAGPDGAGYDDINFSLSAIELIEATPEEHVKYTTASRDSVVGQFDQVLPIVNPILGMLLFDTGLRDTLAATYSWGTVKLLKDNVEQYYPLEDIETLAGMVAGMGGPLLGFPGHTHQFNGAAVGLDESDEAGHSTRAVGMNGYAFLDFDPLKDGSYQLETAGASDLRLRGNDLIRAKLKPPVDDPGAWPPIDRLLHGGECGQDGRDVVLEVVARLPR